MAQATIDNPVINSPFVEPTRHFVMSPRKDKQAKVSAAKDLWTVAVNNWGGAGRWAFHEISDPWDAENVIRANFLSAVTVAG